MYSIINMAEAMQTMNVILHRRNEMMENKLKVAGKLVGQ